MMPYIHIVLPVYGILAALGFAAAFCVFIQRTRICSLGIHKIVQIVASAAIGMLIGSRAVFVLTMLPALIDKFSVQSLLRIIVGGGFVFYGGLLGAMGGLYCYGKIRKMDLNLLFQAVVPCFPLFHAFGRIGCFMAGCCYGIPCSFGFAMAFDTGVIRFPVQLAESLCCFIIFAALLVVEKKRPDVKLLHVYLISYAVVRFCLEFLRGDDVRGIFGCFSTSQWISLGILSFVGIKIVKHSQEE